MSWAAMRLGDLCDIEIGKTPSRAESQYWKGGTFPWLSIADMNQGRYLRETKECVTALGAKNARMKLVKPGTLLLSYKLSIGKVGVAQVPLYTNEAIAALSNLRNSVDSCFMYWALRHVDLLEGADRAAMGATLNKAKLSEIQFQIPPIAEQHRIASVLDKADALLHKRREAIEKLNRLLQSMFLEMFGDPITNPMAFPVFKSGALFLEKPRIGTTRPANGEGVIVVRVGEIGSYEIAYRKCSRVELNMAETERYSLLSGDTVLARAIGSKDQLGKSSYFGGAQETVCIDSHVMRLRPDPSKVDPAWFNFLISSPMGKKMLQAKGGPTAVQFNINTKQASDLDIPVPSLNAQRKFIEISSQVRRQLGIYSDAYWHLGLLFSSIQNRAFAGIL